MTSNRVMSGTYSDFKIVKSRSVIQVIVEIPIEQGDAFIDMFGIPKPGEEVWVAVAELNRAAVGPAEPTEASRAIQQAGIICNSERFGTWLRDHRNMEGVNPQDPATIANALRSILGIKSRTEFNHSPELIESFNRLKGEFDQFAIEGE